MSGPYPPDTERLLAEAAGRIGKLESSQIAAHVTNLVVEHDAWRDQCLNLNPAESLMSRTSRRLLDSDLATRLGEGPPGDKLYPHGPQVRFVDEMEAIIIQLARDLFDARFVEWRPLSTTMANAIVFFSLLKRGDVVLAQHEDGGGNYSYHAQGPLALTGARIEPMARGGPTFELDLDAISAQAAAAKPRMMVIGGSNVLFPYPVAQLRAIADKVGALLVYDAAHIGLLTATGDLQRPLREGAHIVTLSTHKIMGGPVGGLILTDDADLAAAISRISFPGFMQTRDQNKYAALAVSLAELRAHGGTLAKAMVGNAQTLAASLQEAGFRLVGAERGFTRTHQLFLDLGEGAKAFETRCQAAHILVSDCALSGDMALGRRSGARLATHEMTRLGMGAAEMHEVARLIAAAAGDENAAESVRAEVVRLRERFRRVRYSFDPA